MSENSVNFTSPDAAMNVVRTPECPRCGYELTGWVQSWAESCPLDGKCSECGLEFAWRDALNPQFSFPRWCVEGSTPRGAPRCAFKTLLMMLRPWRFWSDLQMHHPPRWLRIPLVLLVCLPCFYLVFAASKGVGAYRGAVFNRSGAVVVGSQPLIDAAKAAAWPFARPVRGIGGGANFSSGYWYRFRIIEDGWRAIRFGFRDALMPEDHINVVSERAFSVCVSILFAPIGFALLPISRQIARVRWRHILRITLYSLTLVMIPLCVDCYAQVAGLRRAWIGEITLGMTIATSLAIIAWWSVATTLYLKIRHGWLVGAYVVIFAYLLQRLIFEVIDYGLALMS